MDSSDPDGLAQSQSANAPGHHNAAGLNGSVANASQSSEKKVVEKQPPGKLLPHMDHVIQRLNINLNGDSGTDANGVNGANDVDNDASSKKKRKGKKPALKIYKGNFIHSTWKKPVAILRNKIIGVDQGKIVFIEDAALLDEILAQYKATAWKKNIVLDVSEPLFFIPGFVDCHAHTYSYCTRGIQGGNNWRFQEGDKSYQQINDDRFTKQVIKDVLRQSLQNGTTSAAWHGTSVESVAIILSNFIDSSRQRSQIGIDFNCDQVKEDVQMLHVTKATDVTTTIAKMHKKGSRVTASVISSLPLVEWLETKMATVRNHLDVPLKANSCKHDGSSRLSELEKLGILDEKTLLTNCCGLAPKDIKLIAEKESSIVHCPSSDYSSPNHRCVIPAILKKKIKVGLGSDMLHSGSLSMAVAVRNCVEKSQSHFNCTKHVQDLENRIKHLENHTKYLDKTLRRIYSEEEEEENNEEESLNEEYVEPLHEEVVPYEEAFRMATLGGASVLGIEEHTGNFEVGKDFDALLIHPSVEDSAFSVYKPYDNMKDILQKFLFTGDDRNILQVYIAGERVK